jgi:hypothetical protein
MKTFDGAAIIAKLHSQYPIGSISKRDILISIPMDFDEEKIQLLNAAITKTIYQQAEEFLNSRPPEKPRGKFSMIARNTSVDTRAEQEEFNKKLSQSVIQTVNSTFTKN